MSFPFIVGGLCGQDIRNPESPLSFKKKNHMPERLQITGPNCRDIISPAAGKNGRGVNLSFMFPTTLNKMEAKVLKTDGDAVSLCFKETKLKVVGIIKHFPVALTPA